MAFNARALPFTLLKIFVLFVNGEVQKFEYLPAGQCALTNEDCSTLNSNYVSITGKLDRLINTVEMAHKYDQEKQIEEKFEEKLKNLQEEIAEKDAKLQKCTPPLPKPNGATGCEDKYRQYGNFCWRYCEGNGPKWCYTKQRCSNGNECTYEKECPGIKCGDDPNCVERC